MKESIWGYWIVVVGISVVSLMMFFQSYTTSSEQDYYLIKNALESSMYESIDFAYYSDTAKLKINREKLVENFVRRFAETVDINKNYKINFYQIYEMPPIASVSVTTRTDDTNFGGDGAPESVEVTNRMTGILFTTSDYIPLLNNGELNQVENKLR